MTAKNLFSIRMRASSCGKHISGAERLVCFDTLEPTVSELIARAMGKGKVPCQITLNIEDAGPEAEIKTALNLVTIKVPDPVAGRKAAASVLLKTEVSEAAIRYALALLSTGAAPSGENMRGAMIMDAVTGARLEHDRDRGIRASRFDWSERGREQIDRALAAVGVTHYRTREAIALATKIAHGPGVIAELCWSDDPDYTAGYVASLKTGYVRFPFLKDEGNNRGGRAIFVNSIGLDIDELKRYLECSVVLIDRAGKCRSAVDPEEFFAKSNNIPA